MSYKGSYYSRKERQEFLHRNFGGHLKDRILDVGCDKKTLATFLGNVNYVGVDLFGEPDIRCSLEKGLPFSDNSFDTIVCLDVLEHLEKIHSVFNELCRVSRKNIILSLPNAFTAAHIIYALIGKNYSGKYGLPAERPVDRHRWFFNINDARNFIHKKSTENGFSIKREFYFYRTQGKLKHINYLAKKMNAAPHLFADSIWYHLESSE